MATRPSKPSAPAKRATSAKSSGGSEDKLDAVLERLGALQRAVDDLRDELRAMGQRPRARRQSRLDPGDSVPHGVAVQEPEPLRPEDRKALRSLERLRKPRRPAS